MSESFGRDQPSNNSYRYIAEPTNDLFKNLSTSPDRMYSKVCKHLDSKFRGRSSNLSYFDYVLGLRASGTQNWSQTTVVVVVVVVYSFAVCF